MLVVNDCAFRSHFTSRWVLYLDFDEFLLLTPPPNSLVAWMTKDHPSVSWISFGSWYHHTKECTHSANVSQGQPQPWDVERLVFKQSEIHCGNPERHPSREVCGGFDGHRKVVIDPRQVELCGVSGEPCMLESHEGGV